MNRACSQWILCKGLIQLTTVTGALFLASCDSTQQLPAPSIGAAEGQQHVAIRIEAENYANKHERWHLTNPDSINEIAPDPDPAHHASASAQGYVELLPDTRVTHDDALLGGVNYWGDTERGPSLEYLVTIPEAGRYYAYVKAFSTGLEDNGIHIGFNDQKPASGKRIQLCSGKGKWTWSSAQRVPANHCGVEKTIYLDIPYPGTHKIVLYAREDGFELDQFILLKDPADGTQNCFVYADRVRCTDTTSGEVTGTFDVPFSETLDGNTVITAPPPVEYVDLEIDLSVNDTTVSVGDDIYYTLKIRNNDNTQTATSVRASATLPGDLQFVSSTSCVAPENNLDCYFSEIAANDTATAIFIASATAPGVHRIDSKVTADQQDLSTANNADSEALEAVPATPSYDAGLSIQHGSNSMGVGDSTTHLLVVSNNGLEPIYDAQISFSGEGLEINSGLENCAVNENTMCTLSEIGVNQSISTPVTITGTVPGLGNLLIELLVSSDENTENNNINLMMRTSASTVNEVSDGELIIEAEDFSKHSKVEAPVEGAYNSEWYANTTQLIPTITPDFDTTPTTNASNSAYVELLPDTRTGVADSPILGLSNFPSGEDSPSLIYTAFFNEPGLYTVNARIRANNEQDAVIHVGIDGTWPSSASGISICNPDGQWQWTHHQTLNGQCEREDLAAIDIITPGLHELMLSAGTDGVEVDKLILRLNSNELPTALGGEPTPFTPTDIDLAIDSKVVDGLYSVQVINPDPDNTAVNIEVQIHAVEAAAADQIEGFDHCAETDGIVTCQMDFVPAGTARKATLMVENSDPKITAVLNHENDPNPDNNSTVANPSGGGAINIMTMLALVLLNSFRRKYVSSD